MHLEWHKENGRPSDNNKEVKKKKERSGEVPCK